MNARDQLIALHLDWKNNFISVGRFAEHHGLTEEEAWALIELSRKVIDHEHPEA